MSFLKFLKREKKDTLDELDLPPAPPPLEGFEENLPDLPDFPELGKEISAPQEESKFELPEPGKDEFPEFPSYQEEKPIPIRTITPPPIPMPSEPEAAEISQPEPERIEEEPVEEPISQEPLFKQSDVRPRRIFSHEKRVLRERPTAKTIYIRVDRFKATLGSINMARSDLRKSEEALAKLESIKSSKDKSMDSLKASLDDLQKKLIFVDKTLFRGD